MMSTTGQQRSTALHDGSSETRTPLRAVRVEMTCPKCGIGKMEAGNVVLTSDPPQYPSTCTECGYSENLWTRYPHITYEPDIMQGESASTADGGPLPTDDGGQ